MALNKESIDLHRKELVMGGVAIFDGEKIRNISAVDFLAYLWRDSLKRRQATES